ncbi:hypothetical protein GPECTOR_5g384 [Gonium pectorale]|uniref:Uncharacterized protein n=1 Tax=Gonium pectorale TaxID=33097 RepID=A0A150GX90_GONPE|nr:hypothetical protein GPECTOR_5g384 [Gonium pectorale]|eukprot:KXZ54298.1 hypothetical protein GPECTOR_5g384 [Gonium pectorale]
MVRWSCQQYRQVCIDQQQFVVYDPQYNPRYSKQKIPGFDVREMVYNWPNPHGNGDKFELGRDIRVPPLAFRVNTTAEPSADLAQPTFSACTSPLIIWQRWLYNVGEVFESSYVRMYEEFAAGALDPSLSLVVATPHGLRLPSYMPLFYGALFKRPVVTLAELSARKDDPQATPSNATAEGWHCFERVTLCRFWKRKGSGLAAAGEHLLRTYADRLPPVSDLFHPQDDADALKVVFASRPNATGRALLNEAELLQACNGLDLAGAEAAARGSGRGGAGRFKRVKCVAHVFGRDLFYDWSLASSIDVLVATHGAAGYHAFYMTRGSSLVEIMPYKFQPDWANRYYALMLEMDRKVFYWSIWITDPNNSAPSAFERERVFRKEYTQRERHVSLPWPALRQHLLAIAEIGCDPASYAAAYVAGRHAISDELQPIPFRPTVGSEGWAHWSQSV